MSLGTPRHEVNKAGPCLQATFVLKVDIGDGARRDELVAILELRAELQTIVLELGVESDPWRELPDGDEQDDYDCDGDKKLALDRGGNARNGAHQRVVGKAVHASDTITATAATACTR